jgi:hypothetical protein
VTTLSWILVLLLVFEFFFALDCFRRMLKAQKDFQAAQTMFAASTKILEGNEMNLLDLGI